MPLTRLSLNLLSWCLAASLSLNLMAVRRYLQSTTEESKARDYLAQNRGALLDRATGAFQNGDYAGAISLIHSLGDGLASESQMVFLEARSCECQGEFARATRLYDQLKAAPYRQQYATNAAQFCLRMASNRTTQGLNREANYRLYEEFMRRRDPAAARFVARRLLPDFKPLAECVTVLLSQMDSRGSISIDAATQQASVTLTTPSAAALDLIKDFDLKELNLSGGAAADLHPLLHWKIETLDLSRNQLSDLFILTTVSVHQLNLADTDVADLRALTCMPLRQLNLSHSLVKDLFPLARCPLQELDLSGAAVCDLSPLRSVALKKLDLRRTKVSDLRPLASLPLEELYLDETEVSDLAPLAGMKLKALSFAHTPVRDLSAVARMPLVELDLRGCTNLTDLTPLLSCKTLERLELPSHLHPPAELANLPRLRFIHQEPRPTTDPPMRPTAL